MDSGEDPTVIQSKVAAYLRSHPTTQAILAPGPDQATGVLRGVKDAGISGKVYVATFDLSPDILKLLCRRSQFSDREWPVSPERPG